MAGGMFDDLIGAALKDQRPAAAPAGAGPETPEANPVPASASPPAPAAPVPAVSGEDGRPGFWDTAGRAAARGLREGFAEWGEGADVVARGAQGQGAFRTGVLPEAPDDDLTHLLETRISKGWSDPNWWAAQIAHGMGRSSPTMGSAIIGGAAGTLVAPGPGTIAGLIGGGGVGGLLQTLAPSYQQGIRSGLDHDAAVDYALRQSGIASVFSAAGAAAPGVPVLGKTAEGALKRPVSEALAQIFGVQPAVGAAHQATAAAVEGQPVSFDDLATGYAANVGTGLAMVGGHRALDTGVRAIGRAVSGADTVSRPPPPRIEPDLTIPVRGVEDLSSAEATAGSRPGLPPDAAATPAVAPAPAAPRRGRRPPPPVIETGDDAAAVTEAANPTLAAAVEPPAGGAAETAPLPVNPRYLRSVREVNARRVERGEYAPEPVEIAVPSRAGDSGRAAAEALSGAGWREAEGPTGPARAVPLAADYSHEVVTPDSSMALATRPELVELADLKRASGDLQPRDRNRAEYEREASMRAARLDPAQLQPGRVSDSGAPIALPDGTVLSGNGRVLSIAEVYRNPALADRAAAYKASLGPAAEGLKEPVLVLRAPEMPRDQAVAFADLSNRSRIAEMSATERAVRDARSIGDLVTLYKGGDFDAMDNAAFLRAFVERAVPPAERASISVNGQLSREGVERLRGAVLASAYGDPALLMRMLESTDDNIRNVTHALTDAAPAMAGLRQEVAAGRIPAELDATSALMEAARLISDLRARRVPVSEYFAQSDAFGRDPLIETWVRAFYHEDLSRAKARGDMAAVIRAYADEALHHQSGGLFADETTAADVLGSARRVARNPAETGGDLAPAAGDLGQGVPEGRAGAGKRADDPGRAATREGSGAALGEFAAGYGAKAAKDAAKAEEADVAPSAAKLAAVNTALRLGRPVAIPPHVVQQSHAALAPLTHMAPEGTRIGMLSRLEPVARHPNGADTRAVFVTPDGDWFTVTAPRSTLLGVRAFRTLDNDIAFLRFDLAGDLGRALGGELGHEVVHVLRAQGRIPEESWGALVGHAEGLRLLESDYRTYLQGIGNRDYRLVPAGVSGREIYDRLYGARPDKAEVMAQEAVAHMVELYHHGGLLPQEVGPVRGLLDDILSGAMARGEARGEAGYGTGMEAAQDRALFAAGPGSAPPRVIDSMGYYSGALDAAHRLRQAKGTPEQMLVMLGKEGAKKAEIEATGLDKFLEGKVSVTKDEIVKYLEENRIGLNENSYAGREWHQNDRNELSQSMYGQEHHRLTQAQADAVDALLNERAKKDGVSGPAKWSSYSLDPSNPSYRETVLHLPATDRRPTFEEWYAKTHVHDMPHGDERRMNLLRAAYERDNANMPAEGNFRSGHFPEPNITGHLMASMVQHEGKPVYLIDQIQDDWAQRIRDDSRNALAQKLYGKSFDDLDAAGRKAVSKEMSAMAERGERPAGVRDESKIAELKRQKDNAYAMLNDLRPQGLPPSQVKRVLDAIGYFGSVDAIRAAHKAHPTADRAELLSYAENVPPEFINAVKSIKLIEAEIKTAEATTPGHPLVNTTDQWVNTTLRRAIRQAAEADADYIAIPHGDTVLSYNPGDEHGMRGFYGSRSSEGIVPKNLRKLLQKIDREAPAPQKVEKLETSQGLQGWQGDKGSYEAPNQWASVDVKNEIDPKQTGFTLFRLTDKVKRAVLDEGQPVFAAGGAVPLRDSVAERALAVARLALGGKA